MLHESGPQLVEEIGLVTNLDIWQLTFFSLLTAISNVSADSECKMPKYTVPKDPAPSLLPPSLTGLESKLFVAF